MAIAKTIAFKITVIIICITTTAFTLNQYAKLIHHLLSINYNWQFELMIVLGMLFFQYLFIYKNTWRLKLDYYFNMLLVSLTGFFITVAINYYKSVLSLQRCCKCILLFCSGY